MRELNLDVIRQELNLAIKYSDECPLTVKKIAQVLELSPSTIYDYLEGRIKINLAFLHAAVIASGGDPQIKKFLEPKGFALIPTGCSEPDKATLSEECLDDLPALASFHAILHKPEATYDRVMRIKQTLLDEIEQNVLIWIRQRNKKDGK